MIKGTIKWPNPLLDIPRKAVELSFARGNAREIAEELGIRSELLYRKPFTDDTITRLKNISVLIANFIKRSQLEDELKEKNASHGNYTITLAK